MVHGPTWLLKRLSADIVPVICRLCNLSIQTGIVPSSLKHARVQPLLKKPTLDPDTCCSYRPISNLSYISKLIERVVVKRFRAHVSDHSLFPVQQSAYRAFHSTETAILAVHNDLVRAVDNNRVSLLVLLDLSAAFDTVDHNILLSVLSRRFSVTGTAFLWFQSYLSGRTQSFIYNSQYTPCHEVDCSVPQGSVLGPVKFVAYTEDIVDVADKHQVRSHFYADDSQMYDSCRPQDVSGVRDRLSRCATDVSCWCASRRLQLNATKTEAVWFGTRRNLDRLHDQDRHVQIDSEIISPVTVVRDLGVYLDDELSMKQHVNRIAATCFFHLRRRRIGRDLTVRLILAFITTWLDYCNSALAGLPQITLAPLQRVQNAAARLVFELRVCEHVTPSLMQLHWLPVRWNGWVVQLILHPQSTFGWLSNAAVLLH